MSVSASVAAVRTSIIWWPSISFEFLQTSTRTEARCLRSSFSCSSATYNLNLNLKRHFFVEGKREDKNITSSDNLPSRLGAKMWVCGSRHIRTLQPGFIQASFHLKAQFILDDSTRGLMCHLQHTALTGGWEFQTRVHAEHQQQRSPPPIFHRAFPFSVSHCSQEFAMESFNTTLHHNGPEIK